MKGLSALALLLVGCVSETAPYHDVQKVVAGRTGHEVRWSHLDDSDVSEATRQALARPLTAEAAVKVALLNNAELQAAFEDLGVARAELVSAWAFPNPSADVAVRFRKDPHPATIDFSVTQDLSQLILLPFKVGAQNVALDAAKLEVAGKAMDLVLQVRTAYYAYLADQQSIELRQSVLDALAASATTAKALREAGNITELELESEQVLFDEARVNAVAAQASVTASRQRLTSILGLWSKADEWRTSSRLAEPSDFALADLEGQAVRNSLDLQIARHRYTAAAKSANVASASGVLPEIKAGVAVEREDDEWSYGPLVAVELPLFYQGQGETARAEAEMRRQGQLLQARAVEVRAAARTVAARVAAARERAIYFKDVLLPARERIVKQTQLQYNAMGVSVFQLLLARRDQIETAQKYVEVLREYWTARAEAEQLRAGRLTSGLGALGSPSPASSSGTAKPLH